MPQDHYAILGVSQNASAEEVKKAYRRLAREHHPDTNQRGATSGDRFKEITHAYEVLSDPAKRQRYDTFGDERATDGGFGDFGGLSDLFSSFFGGAGQGGSTRGTGRGADVLAEVELTLEEASMGVEREVSVSTLDGCTECRGNGSAPGTWPSPCSECEGTGQVQQVRRTIFGNVMTASTCRRCRGAGEVILDPCPRCAGKGRVAVDQSLTVSVPPGVEDGAQLRVSGRGEAGMRGGRKGDLYVAIRITPHETFRRAGEDLGCEVAVPMTVAALGGTVDIPTLDGHESVEVAPGTQSGEVVRLAGKGMPRLGTRARGELVAWLRVVTPTGLDDEQSELLGRFARMRDEPAGGRTLFGKIKEVFN
ncbi:MAG: molecular chaperone DnaJ [Actinomycetota bacterium]|nr:molecular chaperone DnaJ [Actinomycetota bacterium]